MHQTHLMCVCAPALVVINTLPPHINASSKANGVLPSNAPRPIAPPQSPCVTCLFPEWVVAENSREQERTDPPLEVCLSIYVSTSLSHTLSILIILLLVHCSLLPVWR